MTWATNLQDPSFRGVAFEVLGTRDRYNKALIPHALPYKDGVSVENLGMRGQEVALNALLRGDNYQETLKALQKALEVTGPGELVHPVLGSLNVVASDWEVVHEADARDSAIVSMKFIVDRLSDPVFSTTAARVSADRVDALGAEATAQSTEAVASIIQRIAGGDLPRVVEINAAFNQARSTLRRLVDTTSVRVLMADLDPLLQPRAALTDLQSIVQGAFQGISFGGLNALFGDGSGSATPSMSTAVADFHRFNQGLPSSVTITPTTTDPQDVEVSAALTAYSRILSSTTTASAACLVLAAELDELALDRTDIERIAGTSRSALQLAISAARTGLDQERGAQAVAALTSAAFEVQEAARAAIELRPPVVTRQAPVGGHLRLLAHALYGDHTRAGELRRLNRTGRRVFVEVGEEVQAYAE